MKRAINKPYLQFSRLLEFCEVARISFGDLHERAEQRRPKHYVFSEAQDQLFSEREELLGYFLELTKEGATPSRIAKRHKLDRRSTELYLKHLSRIGLVERQEKSRAKLLVKPPFGFGPGSRVLRQEQETFLRSVVSKVLTAAPGTSRHVAVLKHFQLTEEDYDQMVGALENVIHHFAAIAERGLGRGTTSSWRLALACGPGPEMLASQLPRIDS